MKTNKSNSKCIGVRGRGNQGSGFLTQYPPIYPLSTPTPLTPIHFYLPQNLDLKSLIKSNSKKERFFFHYAYVISSIYLSRFTNKKTKKDSLVHLKVDYLREIVSQRKTVQILRDLERWGIIECDHIKKIGSKSFGYRIREPYNSSQFQKVLVTDKKITEKMNNWKEKQKKEAEAAGEDYLHLYNFMWQIDIRYNQAIKFINENYIPFTDDFEARMTMVELIKERDIFFRVDKKGNRAHTNLSNLASDLRKFITYKGKTLAQVDLKNSQPFLFNLLIRNKIDWRNQIQVEEYKKFKSLTEEGKFYEFLMNEFGIPMENDEQRKSFKLLFFGRVFFDVNRTELKKEEKLFQSLFPTIFKFIREYKHEDYTNLAIQLQRAESKAIINECVRKIRNDNPDMFISTIHDSIVVEPDNLEYAKQVIEDVFELNYNLKPGVKQEKF